MSVTAAKGFAASGVSCGIKESGASDLALVHATSGPVPAAAVFTTNRAAAAPVQLSRTHLAKSAGLMSGIILNSGGANAATGPEGLSFAERTCGVLGDTLQVPAQSLLVCSTGLIGVRLPIEKIEAGIPALVGSLGTTTQDARRAATAILTTDTHAKEVVVSNGTFSVGGMVKGAGMIGPNMATMLCVLTTDAEIAPAPLAALLREAVGDSFNELIIDGCTSTNDTVAIFASGAAGEVPEDVLREAITEACQALALELAKDAEGATKVAQIHVIGAKSKADARLVGRSVALSMLVKTSLYGADPYWGRIVSEVGASGADVELDRLSVFYGDTVVFEDDNEVPHDRDALVRYLGGDIVDITCDLHLGSGDANVLTTDIGHGYIEENMRTS